MGKGTRLLVCVLAISAAVTVSAQEKRAAEPTPSEWRSKVQADKKGLVERAMKLTPELPPKTAARYAQIENKVEAVLRYETAAAVPLVQ
ncbi:MAG: hypothetical protein ACXW14_01470 [Burkholderiaceae bacterium]